MIGIMNHSLSSISSRIFRIGLDVFDIVNDLRLHVLFNYFLVISWFLKASKVDARDAVEYGLVGLSIAGTVYLTNRYTDYSYDLVADAGLAKAPRRMYLVVAGMFFVTGIPYIIQNPITIFPSILGLMFGTLYSFKTFFRYPLKNYIVSKNLIAAGSKYIGKLGGALIFVPLTDMLLLRSVSGFAFNLIYEILWDIRDMAADKVGKVSTIPLKFGKSTAILICLGIWLVSLSIQFGEVRHTEHFFAKYIVVLSLILSLLWVKRTRWFHVMIYVHIVMNLIYVNDEVLQYMGVLFWV